MCLNVHTCSGGNDCVCLEEYFVIVLYVPTLFQCPTGWNKLRTLKAFDDYVKFQFCDYNHFLKLDCFIMLIAELLYKEKRSIKRRIVTH